MSIIADLLAMQTADEVQSAQSAPHPVAADVVCTGKSHPVAHIFPL